jgi:hypothetical protein
MRENRTGIDNSIPIPTPTPIFSLSLNFAEQAKAMASAALFENLTGTDARLYQCDILS